MANIKEFYARHGLDVGDTGTIKIEGNSPTANQFLAAKADTRFAFKTLTNGNNITVTHNDTTTTVALPSTIVGDHTIQGNLTLGVLGGVGGNLISYKKITIGDLSTGPLITANDPPMVINQRWNNVATTFKGLTINIDDDASAAASLLLEINAGTTGTTSLFSVRRDGLTTVATNLSLTGTTISASSTSGLTIGTTNASAQTKITSGNNSQAILISNGTDGTKIRLGAGVTAFGTNDTKLYVDGSVTALSTGSGYGWVNNETGQTQTIAGSSKLVKMTTGISLVDTSTSLVYSSPIGHSLTVNGTERMLVTTNGATINGTLVATSKSFEIPHPTIKDAKLRYGCLEGPENGVYFRGKSIDGMIYLPNYWHALIDPTTITVSLTCFGVWEPIYVSDINSNMIRVKTSSGGVPMGFFFTVYAERKDIEKLKVEVLNDC